jgi:enoyl-CoA hydratase/carnithine racemase
MDTAPPAEHLRFERDGRTLTLTFNRPDARNAMTFEMYEALHETCERVDRDPELRVLVLRGSGDKAFASGTDIKQFLEVKTREDALARPVELPWARRTEKGLLCCLHPEEIAKTLATLVVAARELLEAGQQQVMAERM